MGKGEITNALRDLIRGEGVRRASHDLSIDSKDLSMAFRALLESEGYIEARIEDVSIQPGERVPAFYLAAGQAHFGWVFWEVFSQDRQRKIFGSVVKNEKGDWATVLGRRSLVYVCLGRKEEMDVDRPSSL